MSEVLADTALTCTEFSLCFVFCFQGDRGNSFSLCFFRTLTGGMGLEAGLGVGSLLPSLISLRLQKSDQKEPNATDRSPFSSK